MKEKKAKKNKGGKILLTVILVILAVAAVYSFFCLAAGPLFYPDFYKSATRVAKIPSCRNMTYYTIGRMGFQGVLRLCARLPHRISR